MKGAVAIAVFFPVFKAFAAALLVSVPSGQLSPFWLSPVGKSLAKKSIKRVPVLAFDAMERQVTVGEFKAFLNTHPEWQKNKASPLFSDQAYLQNLTEPMPPDDVPMTSVSWFAARSYCSSLGMRLPTTNEWEYMAAASETQREASADRKFLQRILDWYGEPQDQGLKPTKSIYRNLYGLWDLHGLVWEWVSDFNSTFVTGESREDAALNKDLFCGAGNLSGGNKENYAAFMRFAFRSSLKGTSSIWNLGFRCVRSK